MSEFSTRFWRPIESRTQIHNIILESVIIMIGMSHETHIHIALERVTIIIGMSHETRIHSIALESNYYDWRIVKRISSTKKQRSTYQFLWYMILTNFVIG